VFEIIYAWLDKISPARMACGRVGHEDQKETCGGVLLKLVGRIPSHMAIACFCIATRVVYSLHAYTDTVLCYNAIGTFTAHARLHPSRPLSASVSKRRALLSMRPRVRSSMHMRAPLSVFVAIVVMQVSVHFSIFVFVALFISFIFVCSRFLVWVARLLHGCSPVTRCNCMPYVPDRLSSCRVSRTRCTRPIATGLERRMSNITAWLSLLWQCKASSLRDFLRQDATD
jgi:hypothetical protein